MECVVVCDRQGQRRRLVIPPDVVSAGRDAVAAYVRRPPKDALEAAEILPPLSLPTPAPDPADVAEE